MQSGMSIPQKPSPDNQNIPLQIRYFGVADLVIIVLLLAGILCALPALSALSPTTVSIYRDNNLIARYPLDTDRTFSVTGYVGMVTVAIKDHTVSIIKASCPHQICIQSGKISTAHAQIVCAPNHLLITIASPSSGTLDAIVR